MRITDKALLDRVTKGKGANDGGGMSDWAARQIAHALEDSKSSGGHSGQGSPKKQTQAASKRVVGESKGEAAVRLALLAAFGDWHRGGEVVAELIPFQTRRYRADFALPLRRVSIEIDGWRHHGEFLSDHLADRERGLFFASHDWLAFRIAHGQAINNPSMLVDAVSRCLQYRPSIPREAIEIELVPHKHGVWHRLRYL